MPLDAAGEKHQTYDQQPYEEEGADDRVHDGCGVYPDELHSDSEDGGHRGDESQVSADFPLISGRYYEGQPGEGEADLAGEPADVGRGLGYRIYDHGEEEHRNRPERTPILPDATAHAPEMAVSKPEAANRYGTRGVPSRSRIIHVFVRYQDPAIRVIPDRKRAAPPSP